MHISKFEAGPNLFLHNNSLVCDSRFSTSPSQRRPNLLPFQLQYEPAALPASPPRLTAAAVAGQEPAAGEAVLPLTLHTQDHQLAVFAWLQVTLRGFTWFQITLRGSTWLYVVPSDFTWFHVTLRGLTWLHVALRGFTWLYVVSLSFTWLYEAPRDSTWPYVAPRDWLHTNWTNINILWDLFE